MESCCVCPYCKVNLIDKEEYALIGARRYAHAACMLREAEKDPNLYKKEIIDPLDNVTCALSPAGVQCQKRSDCVND